MNRVRTVFSVLRKHGMPALLARVGERLTALTGRPPSLVQYEDAIAVDWSQPHPAVLNPLVVADGPLTVAWIMSPPGVSSGGHQNLYRFIDYLERAGHKVKIYLYSVRNTSSAAEIMAMTANSASYPNVAATVEWYTEAGFSADVDAVFATGWETAYPAFRDASPARRFYFVQDFEPLFYPMGTDALLAENSYRFGFLGITAGEWLARKLRSDYGMTASPYDFGSDERHYSVSNADRRDAVFFYARPETPRRGFELGIMALDLVARDRPGTPIIMAGQSLRGFDIPFEHENPGNLQVSELNALYNRCAAGLVLSLTNMSLLPLELLAAGVIPVVNDADNNRLVSDNPFIAYTTPTPRALADRILEILDRPDQAEHAARGAASVQSTTWAHSGEQFVAAFERGMHG